MPPLPESVRRPLDVAEGAATIARPMTQVCHQEREAVALVGQRSGNGESEGGEIAPARSL